MDLEFFHVADEAIISKDGKISAIGIFDIIWAEDVPALHPKLALVAKVSAPLYAGSAHHVQIHFVNEDGQVLWESPERELTLKPRGRGYPMSGNVAASLRFLELPTFGDFAFKLLVDGQPIGTVALAVRPLADRES